MCTYTAYLPLAHARERNPSLPASSAKRFKCLRQPVRGVVEHCLLERGLLSVPRLRVFVALDVANISHFAVFHKQLHVSVMSLYSK